MLRNLDITDVNFCVTLLDFVRIMNAKARKRLEVALLKELDDVCNDRERSYQTTFILELLKQCDFDGWLADTALLDSIFDSDNVDVKLVLHFQLYYYVYSLNLFALAVWIKLMSRR